MVDYLRVYIISILLILLQLHAAPAIQMPDPPPDSTEHKMDVRPVYYYVNTIERDGSKYTDHTFNVFPVIFDILILEVSKRYVCRITIHLQQ